MAIGYTDAEVEPIIEQIGKEHGINTKTKFCDVVFRHMIEIHKAGHSPLLLLECVAAMCAEKSPIQMEMHITAPPDLMKRAGMVSPPKRKPVGGNGQ